MVHRDVFRSPGALMVLAAGVIFSASNLAAQLDRSGPPTTANPLARDTASVEAGGNLFRQYCTGCHGRGGEGGQGEGQGPNLATAWEVRRAKDPELFGFIKNGVKGTAMPAFPLPDDQIRQLAAFVRSLNAPAVSLPVSGNVQAGESVFFGKGQCGSCHMIRGRGGYLGPDLSDVGAKRRLGELQDSLTNPSIIPSADYRPLFVAGADGKQLRAVAKHSSYWSAQILDEAGGLHLLHGNDLQKLAFGQKSWMSPDFVKGLSKPELNDLVAFLSRQSVRAPNEPKDAPAPKEGPQ
ncbi:MAG: c-type cytochrome [Bryobacteraceae bacterium]